MPLVLLVEFLVRPHFAERFGELVLPMRKASVERSPAAGASMSSSAGGSGGASSSTRSMTTTMPSIAMCTRRISIASPPPSTDRSRSVRSGRLRFLAPPPNQIGNAWYWRLPARRMGSARPKPKRRKMRGKAKRPSTAHKERMAGAKKRPAIHMGGSA